MTTNPERAGAPATPASVGAAAPSTMSPQVADALLLPRVYIEAMVRHARAFTPQECCGLIAGKDGQAMRRYELRNDNPSVLRYTANATDQLKAMNDMDAHDWDLLVIYHSHTHTQAYPSATDIGLAFYPEAAYVIVSLQEGDAPRVRAYRILDGIVTERPIVLDKRPVQA